MTNTIDQTFTANLNTSRPDKTIWKLEYKINGETLEGYGRNLNEAYSNLMMQVGVYASKHN